MQFDRASAFAAARVRRRVFGAGIAAILCAGITPSPSADAAAHNAARVDVAMSASTTSTSAGESIVYTLNVRNAGKVDAAGTIVRDPQPVGLSTFDWTCSGSACPNRSGKGSLHEPLASFPPGASVTYTIAARVDAQPPSRITHTATANPPAQGDCSDRAGIHAPPCVARVVNPLRAHSCAQAGAPACPSALASPQGGAASPSLSVSQSAVGYSTSNQNFSYLIDITNPAASGATANATRLEIPIPSGIASFDGWSCDHNGSPCSVNSGTGAIDQILDTLQPGDTYAFTINVTKSGSLPSTITSDVTVTPPAPFVCESTGAQPPCTSQFVLDTNNVATLGLTLTKNSASATPGTQIIYTLTLDNPQVSGTPANGTKLDFPQPAGIASMTWMCQTNGAECPTPSGTGALSETLNALPGGSGVTYEFTATLSASPPVFVAASATATTPAGLTVTCAGNGATAPCTASDNLPTVPLIEIQNGFSENSAMPGMALHYGLRVSNFGTAIDSAMHVSDPTTPGLGAITWTCEGSTSYICPSMSGAGAIEQDIASFALDDFAVYALSATVDTSPPAQITRTATVTPPAPAVCGSPNPNSWPRIAPAVSAPPCVSSASVYSSSFLSVSQSANVAQLVPGGSVVYTVIVHNAGLPSNGARLLVPMPAGIDQVGWTCSPAGDVQCPAISGSGSIDEVLGHVSPGDTLTFTLTGHVSDNASGSVTSTATVVPEIGGACAGSCSASLTLPLATVPSANLKITKSANLQTAMPGDTIVYAITVRNLGSAAAINTALSDPLPAGIASFNWACTSTTAECPSASGSGAIAQMIPTLTGQVQYTVSAIVDASASDIVFNTASITPANGATCDQAQCAASAATSIEQPVAQVVVTSTSNIANGAQAPAGQPVRWTITATNTGAPTSAPLTITDQLPAAIENIVVSADPAVRCTPSQPTGGQSLVCTIAAGFSGSATIVIDARVSLDATGTLSNAVSASGADQPVCASCTTSSPIEPATDIELGNARPFSAAGINGSLFDLVNLRGATQVTLNVTPASSVQVFGSYASACTTSADGDSVVVSCPPPLPTLQMACSGATCSVGSLAAGSTLTLFVAANTPGAALTVAASAPNDIAPANNTLSIAATGTP